MPRQHKKVLNKNINVYKLCDLQLYLMSQLDDFMLVYSTSYDLGIMFGHCANRKLSLILPLQIKELASEKFL